MGHKLAIDFGTTNSVVALYDEAAGAGKTVPITAMRVSVNASTHLIPTLLYVNDGRSAKVTIGAQVRAAQLDQLPGNRLFRNFKRAIGGDASEPRLIDGAPWTDMDAGRAFLHHQIASLPNWSMRSTSWWSPSR